MACYLWHSMWMNCLCRGWRQQLGDYFQPNNSSGWWSPKVVPLLHHSKPNGFAGVSCAFCALVSSGRQLAARHRYISVVSTMIAHYSKRSQRSENGSDLAPNSERVAPVAPLMKRNALAIHSLHIAGCMWPFACHCRRWFYGCCNCRRPNWTFAANTASGKRRIPSAMSVPPTILRTPARIRIEWTPIAVPSVNFVSVSLSEMLNLFRVVEQR